MSPVSLLYTSTAFKVYSTQTINAYLRHDPKPPSLERVASKGVHTYATKRAAPASRQVSRAASQSQSFPA